MKLVLVTGGARSGKSDYAVARALELGGANVTFVATARALDSEMVTRIERHRATRPLGWRTVEAPENVGQAITAAATNVVVLDCLTLLCATALCEVQGRDPDAAQDAVLSVVGDLLEAADRRPGVLIAVTNEVGDGIVPANESARVFRDALGVVNRTVAYRANEVVLMVCGIPVVVKACAEPGGP